MSRYSFLRRRSLFIITACVLPLLVGCSAVGEFLGVRVRLEKLQVTAVSASLVNKRDHSQVSALGPGQSMSLVISATTQDGKQYPTVGVGRGKVAFDNYTIQATIVQVNKRGTVSLSSDPRVSEGRVAHLHIVPTAHPELAADLDIPFRYDIPFTANYSGADGHDGLSGNDGLDGSSGTDGFPGTIDPTTGALGAPGPGGNGSDGQNGGAGQDGGDGSAAGNVNAWIRLEPGPKPLLQIKVVSGTRQSFYLVDPNGGSLEILANGGAGGRGGSGGRGGRGGRGGSGSPSGLDGQNGLPGQDGHAGSDGAAGTIAISVDPAAEPFMKCISWSNHGANGGSGPAPKITVEPVAVLW
jgi:hypothetical protein